MFIWLFVVGMVFPLIKTKINDAMTVQLRRKIAKKKSTWTKSGQGTDKLYSSNWIHYGRLAFLAPFCGFKKQGHFKENKFVKR